MRQNLMKSKKWISFVMDFGLYTCTMHEQIPPVVKNSWDLI
jgi:hypothetical protein